jgi:suppressor of tumorigenicity protein 13
MALMQDQEVISALMDIQTNPANMAKYQNNPKVQRAIEKLAAKMGAQAGGPPPPSAGRSPFGGGPPPSSGATGNTDSMGLD